MSGGGIRQWTKDRNLKREYVEEETGIKRAMGWRRKAVTNHCRLRGGKGIGKWWESRIGRTGDTACPRCKEEEETPDHIVFRCRGKGCGGKRKKRVG